MENEKISNNKIVNIDRRQAIRLDEEMFRVWGERYLLYRRNWNMAGTYIEEKREHVQFTQPINIDLEITSYCNLHCKMCFRNKQNVDVPQNMSMELVNKIVEEEKIMNIEAVMLGGGAECTLHPQFLEILEKYQQYLL